MNSYNKVKHSSIYKKNSKSRAVFLTEHIVNDAANT